MLGSVAGSGGADGGGGGVDLFVFAREVSSLDDNVQLNAQGNLVQDNTALGTETTLFPGIGGEGCRVGPDRGIGRIEVAAESNQPVRVAQGGHDDYVFRKIDLRLRRSRFRCASKPFPGGCPGRCRGAQGSL